jgi:hypothetical protein
MNQSLITNKHEVFIYRLKEGTASSYYLKNGEKNILPERIGYSEDCFLKLQKKGRALTEKKKGQVTGTFRTDEVSSYKMNKPYRLFSTVWEAQICPEIIGYGDIGISNDKGRIESSNDLFILFKPCNDVLEIHLFRSLMESKNEVMKYFNRHIKEQALERAC